MSTPLLAAILLTFAQGAGAAAAPAAAPPATAALPPLNAEQRGALRCGVAFGLVAQLQKAGAPEGAKYPPLAERGREYFVRVAAKLLSETGAGRAELGEWVMIETDAFTAAPDSLPAAMPGCLELLGLAGL